MFTRLTFPTILVVPWCLAVLRPSPALADHQEGDSLAAQLHNLGIDLSGPSQCCPQVVEAVFDRGRVVFDTVTGDLTVLDPQDNVLTTGWASVNTEDPMRFVFGGAAWNESFTGIAEPTEVSGTFAVSISAGGATGLWQIDLGPIVSGEVTGAERRCHCQNGQGGSCTQRDCDEHNTCTDPDIGTCEWYTPGPCGPGVLAVVAVAFCLPALSGRHRAGKCELAESVENGSV